MSPTLAGITLQLLAIAFFVAMDTTIKVMTAEFAVSQLLFCRFAVHVVLVALLLRLFTGPLPWRSRAPGLQALRSLCLASANFMFSHALAQVPLADATAVNFASPLLTVALAAVWLQERVGPRRWLGVAVGLLGVAVALRPPFLTGGPLPHWALLLPLGTAALYAVYQILTRKLATVDDPRTTILHTGIAAALASAVAQPFVWQWPMGGWGWAGLVALGALGAVGHGFLVLAFARAPASLLAPMSYTQLVWAVLASMLVFGDWPDRWTLIGAIIIAVGGVLVALPQRRG
ncbi:DMT family transporter [Pseudoroseomonas cervicalis]|uniref:DMT family transporter n=1 Tax=Teichococcus cervicalis TaxID=204525 RepID=UPI0022F16CFD|nr:DMT family transporter [Pseudoroseomonas cervicalis]WBV42273.1 DMT family transporter [Pseudoroseomonas cervicalis]